MGDRGIIVIKNGADCAPAIYQHWGGAGMLQDLKAALPVMRNGDPTYSAARLCWHVCNKSPSRNTDYVGLFDPPKDLGAATLKEYSHGDAGVLVYDCGTGLVTAHDGYLLADEPPDYIGDEDRIPAEGVNIGLPPE